MGKQSGRDRGRENSKKKRLRAGRYRGKTEGEIEEIDRGSE